jgi:hypothetical protein
MAGAGMLLQAQTQSSVARATYEDAAVPWLTGGACHQATEPCASHQPANTVCHQATEPPPPLGPARPPRHPPGNVGGGANP